MLRVISKSAMCGLGLLAAASVAGAADWYDNVSLKLERVEQDASGVIYLMVNTWASGGTGVTVTGHATSCYVTSVRLTAPSGKEKEWLSMVLAATLAGKSVSVYGECNAAGYYIDGSRLIVEYQ